MSKEITIAIDAMGGDYAPDQIVKGAIRAAREISGIKIILTGKEAEVKQVVEANGGCCLKNIEIIDAPEDITMDEKNPARAVRKAKNSSVVVANRLVAEGKADAVIAAGHTGAATAASLFELKRVEGFERPCICTVIPTIESKMLLIDGGSNIETTPEQMRQSAIIGDILAKILFKTNKPRTALLNVGGEEGKGTARYQEAYDLLKNEARINFTGNVEGKTIIDDVCEIAICDGFVGNIHLKALEGGLKMMISALQRQIKSRGPLEMLGGLLLKLSGAFDRIKDHFHPNSYGGALLGGLNGISLISHGSSNDEAIMNACKHAKLLVENKVIEAVKAEF
ncbi:MAG: phosphate acyltransferase PlsX [Candidatus Melainabacteria bacterium]|nr:phosphate acyltransferase PlsX [Candidatus Melainabacteria bacterium]